MFGWFPFSGREPIRYGLTLVAAAANEPVSVTEQKTHSRIDISTDDTYIGTLITAARIWAENYLSRRIVTQTWDLLLDQPPWLSHEIRCPWGPWQSITYIHYIDAAGNTQTITNTDYNLDTGTFEPRIYLSFAKIWPITRWIQNSVTIRHVSGYATVPENFKLAIKMLVDGWYTKERASISEQAFQRVQYGVESLLMNERQSFL